MATEQDTVSTGAIGTLVAVLALAVVVVGLGVTALVRSEQTALAAERESAANLRPIRELKAAQLAELNASPAWVDRGHGVVTIPISRAMELVVEEARNHDEKSAPVTESSSSVAGAAAAAPAEKVEKAEISEPKQPLRRSNESSTKANGLPDAPPGAAR
ncbi:MAG: hypothetical protein QM784_26770 [Polyangiaceae bacterium]